MTSPESLGRGRSLAAPQFPSDDGSADPAVRHLLEAVAVGEDGARRLARELRDRRLLTCVVAVLDSAGEDGEEKDSHMAVVSMVNAAGERGLLAFTGLDSLAAWNPDARPVPALGRDIARAAIEDGAAAVVVDVTGPRSAVLTGWALRALADELDLPTVTSRIHALLAPVVGPASSADVIDVRTLDSTDLGLDALGLEVPDVDVLVLLHGIDGPTAAGLLDADDALYALVPGGLAVVPLD